jgi:HD-GYP domain-containing protein (c-di-GMP phosphodiesterase class II)
MGFQDAWLKELYNGALLHDIGKCRVPIKILDKPGPLTSDEFAEVRRHIEYGLIEMAIYPDMLWPGALCALSPRALGRQWLFRD